MRDHAHASTVENVVTAITARVRSGNLAPGQRLTESEFTQRLGVSRSTVREAFQRLASDGLLAFEPNRGVTVRQLSRKGVDQLFQVRGALEVLAVRLAAPVILAEPAKLETLQTELDKAVSSGDMQRFSDLNQEFHGLFVKSAGNALLAETLRRLNNSIYWLQFRMLVHRQEVLNSNAQHQALVRAILDGQLQRAEAIMFDHIEASRTLIQSLADDHFTAD